MRRFYLAAIAATGLLAGGASAQTFISTDVTTDTTWGAGGVACPIVLEQVIFVKNGATLTIQPGCIVRGQPRSGPTGQGNATAPGALAITQNGYINAVGQPNNPIIFTTAAIDVNGDGVADETGGFKDQYTGSEALLDDDPLGAPLAPLNSAGDGNVQLWGGLVMLGEAPLNVADTAAAAYGEEIVEGLNLGEFQAADITYGGKDPHDSSGQMAFASIRHAGDPIVTAKELNCLTLGGVGDGTLLSHIECYANWDDGYEWFGGTVDSDHLFAFAIADDHFDKDQGYTGVGQFWYGLAPHFIEDDGGDFGSPDTPRMGEWDGDDSNANIRLGSTSAAVDGTCWPLSAAAVFNMTLQGPAVAGTNNATNVQGDMRGIQMRNGFAGKVHNSVVVNTDVGGNGSSGADDPANGLQIGGGSACAQQTSDHINANPPLVWVMSTSFDDAPVPAGSATSALTNGDNNCVALGGLSPACNNNTTTFAGLRNEQNGFEPKGNAQGKLAASLLTGLNGPLDPRTTGFAGTAGGVPPYLPGTDGSATYRGAFAAGGPNWLTGKALGGTQAFPGWTTLSNSQMVVDF